MCAAGSLLDDIGKGAAASEIGVAGSDGVAFSWDLFFGAGLSAAAIWIDSVGDGGVDGISAVADWSDAWRDSGIEGRVATVAFAARGASWARAGLSV